MNPVSSTYAIDVLTESRRGGVFETLRVYNGKAFRLEDHLNRLKESCVTASISLAKNPEELKGEVERYLKAKGVQDASLRVTVLRGKNQSGKCGFLLRPFKPLPVVIYQRGVRIATSSFMRNSPAAVEGRIKSDEFLGGVLAIAGKNDDIFEMLWLNASGYVTEGTVSNIFLIKEGILKTPPCYCGVLGGITGNVIVELAGKLNLTVEKTLLTRHDLYNADEVFLTNTNIEIVPVREVDGRVTGDGAPGYRTRMLMADFRRRAQGCLT